MTFLALALQLIGVIGKAKDAIAEIRAVVARDTPEDLAGFDAAVAAARTPSQDAANAAARENAEDTPGG